MYGCDGTNLITNDAYMKTKRNALMPSAPAASAESFTSVRAAARAPFELTSLALAATFSLSPIYSAKPFGCDGMGYSVPDVVVCEHQPFARVWLSRAATNTAQTVDYLTTDGSARAGIDYGALSGTATFAPGQSSTAVDVPILDNGLVDGLRDFNLILTNASPGLGLGVSRWIRIEDNELRAAVDPLFVPEVRPGQLGERQYFVAAMPDGRVLVPGEPGLLTMLQSNGSLDPQFATTLPNFFTGVRWAQVQPDGRILVSGWNPYGNLAPWLVRLLPTGATESVFVISNFTGTAASQPDGRILVVTTNINQVPVLRRFNGDGTLDGGFSPSTLTGLACQFAFQNDGKLLVAGDFIQTASRLLRFNPDGTVDNSFLAPASTVEGLLFLRRNGKIVVSDGTNIIQLNTNGSFDHIMESGSPTLELADGRLVSIEAGMGILGYGSVGERIENGPYTALASMRGWPGSCTYSGLTLAPDVADRILLAGNIESTEGFSRGRLVRLFANPPERDFRVLTPAEFVRGGVAHIQVVRTGPSTNAASVSFATTDDTAFANVDYVPQTGTLNFAPLEVSKEVVVPLLHRTGVMERTIFNLELSNPSAGYATIAATPILILPDLRLAPESLQVTNGMMLLRLDGTVPGRTYSLESSTNLINWSSLTASAANGPTTTFQFPRPSGSVRFFRAR